MITPRKLAFTAALYNTFSMAGAVLSVKRLGFPFSTPDPWLFAVYHKDAFPEGDEHMRVPGGKRGNG